jgi:FAD/FMN-containing dehydrogenase
MASGASSPTIRNFGGNVRFTPKFFYTPTTEAEVLAILDRHARGQVRVGGALHAWSPAVVSAEAYIDLRHFNRVDVHTAADGTVWATVGGGCRIKHLLAKLHRQSRATLPALGLITEQTLAGAIATATHGSGRHSLSHYIAEVRAAAYDPTTGQARIYCWTTGDLLRAARCALGCMGVVLAVRFRCVPRYDVAEVMVPCANLEEVLAGEAEFPLQQFYLLPHRWAYYAQRRRIVPVRTGHGWAAPPYRVWWAYGIDIGLHLGIHTVAAWCKSRRLTHFFYRHVVPNLIVQNVTVVDRSDRMLIMEHELFRHLETELFVPARCLPAAAAFVRAIVEVFDGSGQLPDAVAADLARIGLLEELHSYRGTFTHHYPITFRRVLPDDALISTASGTEPWYAISFITYARPWRPFQQLASFLARSMARLFGARPHWGKWFPLGAAEVEQLYPDLPRFRQCCQQVDPGGVFRNEFVRRTLFAEHATTPAQQVGFDFAAASG